MSFQNYYEDLDYNLSDFIGKIQKEVGTVINTFGSFFDSDDINYKDYEFTVFPSNIFNPNENVHTRIWLSQGGESPVIIHDSNNRPQIISPENVKSRQNAFFGEDYDYENDENLEDFFEVFNAPFAIYVLLSLLLLILTAFLAILCHRRRRLQYLQQRSLDNREEFRAEFYEPCEQNLIVEGKFDLPPSYEKVKQEDDMLPKYEDIGKENIVWTKKKTFFLKFFNFSSCLQFNPAPG